MSSPSTADLETTTPAPSQLPSTTTSSPPPSPSSAPHTTPEADLKKCWICFADETEDPPSLPARWRNPCACALVAHEECLLDWISDVETTAHRAAKRPVLKCPQCKTDIKLRRPRDLVVETVNLLGRLGYAVLVPGAALLGLTALYKIFRIHGMHSVQMVFGDRDGTRILAPLLAADGALGSWNPRELLRGMREHWRLYVGVPLITPVLVLSRTDLFDAFMPILPWAFFFTRDTLEHAHNMRWSSSGSSFANLSWPPSAAFTFAMLPYVRMLYNAHYSAFWAPKVQRWEQSLVPRGNRATDAEEVALQEQNQDGFDDDEIVPNGNQAVFEFRLDANIFPDWIGDREPPPPPPPPQAQAQAQAAPANLAPVEDHAPAPGAAVDALDAAPELGGINDAEPILIADEEGIVHAVPGPGAPLEARNRADQRIAFSIEGLTSKLLEALLYPAASALAGRCLIYLLPTSWTTLPLPSPSSIFTRKVDARPTGLLQSRWGRSVIGGCLLVVVRDAIMLYVKWRMAQQHRKAEVRNYDGKTQRKHVVAD